MSAGLSAEAMAYGRRIAAQMLRGNGRKGHGGTRGVCHRQMGEAQLIALAAIAFDEGRKAK